MGEMAEYYEERYWGNCDEWWDDERRQVKQSQRKRHFQDLAPIGCWRQKDDSIIAIAAMSNEHLANTVGMLRCRIDDGGEENPKYNQLMLEVAKRCQTSPELAVYPFGSFKDDADRRFVEYAKAGTIRPKTLSRAKIREMQYAFRY